MGNADESCGVRRSSGRRHMGGARLYCKGMVDITGGGSYQCGNVGADSDVVNEHRERRAGQCMLRQERFKF